MQIVLMYHDVYVDSYNESGFLKESTNQYKISAQEFKKHVEAVTGFCKTNQDIKVKFTFDDGGKSFSTVIAPILEQYGINGTFFISAKYIGNESFVSFEQIDNLRKKGHIIGSHSFSHPNLASLTKDEIIGEWKKSIEVLKPFLKKNYCASIPEGYSSNDVVEAALDNGISVLYTSEPTTKIRKKDGMYIIGRYVVYEGMSADDVLSIISNRKKRLMLKAKWQLINCIKFIFGNKYDFVKAIIYKKIVRR